MKKNKYLWLVLLILVFGIGFWAGKFYQTKNLLVKAEIVKVTRVIDGDTIELETGMRVRYLGVDTPEDATCFTDQATRKNKELVEGKTVRLEKDVSDKDVYGRLLRYVYVDNLFINLELVKQGYARIATFSPDVKFASLFLSAEQEARENNLGLWKTCKM